MQAVSTPSLNGSPVSGNKGKRGTRRTASSATPAIPAKKPRRNKAALSSRRRMAVGVGGVGVAVLLLSVAHCTEAIAHLTGSSVVLSMLLAVGVDAGMVACELAAIQSAHDARPHCRRWARTYIVLAVLLSCVLNGWASGHNADEGLRVAAWVVGGLIPVLVFVLGQVAGLLWRSSSPALPCSVRAWKPSPGCDPSARQTDGIGQRTV